MVLRFAAPSPADRMGIIEAHQPPAVRPVQRERVVDAMRLPRRHGHPCDDKSNPVTALRVNDEDLAIEVEKHIEGRVARLGHSI